MYNACKNLQCDSFILRLKMFLEGTLEVFLHLAAQ